MRSLVASGCFRSRRGPVSGEQSRALVGSPCRCYPAATGRDHDVIEKSRNRYYYSQQPLVYVRPVRDLPVAVLLLVLRGIGHVIDGSCDRTGARSMRCTVM